MSVVVNYYWITRVSILQVFRDGPIHKNVRSVLGFDFERGSIRKLCLVILKRIKKCVRAVLAVVRWIVTPDLPPATLQIADLKLAFCCDSFVVPTWCCDLREPEASVVCQAPRKASVVEVGVGKEASSKTGLGGGFHK